MSKLENTTEQWPGDVRTKMTLLVSLPFFIILGVKVKVSFEVSFAVNIHFVMILIKINRIGHSLHCSACLTRGEVSTLASKNYLHKKGIDSGMCLESAAHCVALWSIGLSPDRSAMRLSLV